MDGTRDQETPREQPGDTPATGAEAEPDGNNDTTDSLPDKETDSDPRSSEPDAEASADEDSDSADGSGDDKPTDVLAVRRPRPSASDPDDPFGPEPAWLQSGSPKRTAFGLIAVVVLLGAVAGIGWAAFRPDDTDAAGGGADVPATAACQVAAHDGDPNPVAVPTLGTAEPRQTATVTTSAGAVSILLFGDVAPCGVSGFNYLAEQGFYANSPCYRVTTQPIDPTVTLRCGDPTGSGKGGPGFRYRAEQSFTGQIGSNYFALINDRSGEAGSAFAFVRGESQPTASLSVIGQVIAGFDVLDQLGGMAGVKYDDTPPQPVQILSVEIEKGTATLPPTQDSTSSVPGETSGLPGDSSELPTGTSGLPGGSSGLPGGTGLPDGSDGASTEPGPG